MVFTIRKTSVSGDVIFTTNPPLIFFRKDSFEITDNPIWTTGDVINREGNKSHYRGSNDAVMKMILVLSGSSRKTNLATIRANWGEIWYLDASDHDSNLSGAYVQNTSPRIKYVNRRNDEVNSYVLVEMSWRKYNN